ncbi:S-adenosyl-L-methionine-dependent methyltransferase [Diplogelasinospora grovesii]|uniref:S-adenosyl-L-methionine-dependent methyltransferase n=1 Tax=Diplogelasinospora grovesii TaxID=303347 RepID=A0AAN6N2P5_9PEZI|nr:S-adenosyl-L-methionine-dependent methyltransferase [Diplogelasinospora grovesii]
MFHLTFEEELRQRRLFIAPVRNPAIILNVGTGTGYWAFDMARMFPQTRIYMTDIALIQPDLIPVNIHPYLDDANEKWTWAVGSLDFVHLRGLAGCITNWRATFADAWECMRPGAYIEVCDLSLRFGRQGDETHSDDIWARCSQLIREVASSAGRALAIVESDQCELWMREAGFEIVTQRRVQAYVGTWHRAHKESGALLLKILLGIIEDYVTYTHYKAGRPLKEHRAYIKGLRDKLMEHSAGVFTEV